MPINETDSRKPKIALVLGSGGIKTTASIGLFRALEEQNIRVNEVFASSAGSIFGSLYCLGYNYSQIERLTLRCWRNKLFSDVDLRAFWRLVFQSFCGKKRPRKNLSDFGIIRGIRIESVLNEVFGGATFDQLKIPLTVVAFDAVNGDQVLLRDGKLAAAVRASIALPLIMKPRALGGKILLDGGLASPLPIDIAIQSGAEIVIAMGFDSPTNSSNGQPLGFILDVVNLALKRLFERIWSFAYEGYPNVIIINLALNGSVRFFETKKIPLAIEFGYSEASKRLMSAKAEGIFVDPVVAAFQADPQTQTTGRPCSK